MKLLAIDTATEACSAALWLDGEIIEKYCISGNEHSRLIMPMIDNLLAEAGLGPATLDVIAFGRGPGSFTGVRIAAGVTQGIAFGLDKPVVPVSNLASVAQDFFDSSAEDSALVAMDARMREVYWGVFIRNDQGMAVPLTEEKVAPPSAVEFSGEQVVGVGTGWDAYAEELSVQLGNRLLRYEKGRLPRASAIARLGAFGFSSGNWVTAENALPTYLRDNVAKKPASTV